MNEENRAICAKFLNDAMGNLYQARYATIGPEILDGYPSCGSCYPEMDREAFDKIANLQTDLQSLISKVSEQKRDLEN